MQGGNPNTVQSVTVRENKMAEKSTSDHSPQVPQPRFSIGALSRATGIPVDTLRAWERRYGFPAPVRKPSGHRTYALADVPRLRRIATALEQGLRAGDVVPASDDQLDAMLGSLTPAPTTETGAGGISSFGPETVSGDQLLDYVRAFDADHLTRALLTDWARSTPLEFLTERIVPLIHAVGNAWETGELNIRHEHFLSERLSDLLRSIRLPFENRATSRSVALATLSGERHGLGLQMAALLFAAHGYRVVLLGTDIPVAEVAQAAKRARVTAVALSISVVSSGSRTNRTVARLRRLLPSSIALLAGGRGAAALKGVTNLPDFLALQAWLENGSHAR